MADSWYSRVELVRRIEDWNSRMEVGLGRRCWSENDVGCWGKLVEGKVVFEG